MSLLDVLATANEAAALRNDDQFDKSLLRDPFSVCVKLYVKEGDNFPTNGSHEIITLNANSKYGDLCEDIKTAFLKIQKGNDLIRSNMDRRCYWSDQHVIYRIKAVWNPTAEWAGVGIEPAAGDVTVITEANCSSILAAMKSATALSTLSVTIRVPGRD
jgi:hypothetical protein